VLTNWAEVFGSEAYVENCSLPALPPSALAEGQTPPPERVFQIGREVWIEREDFAEVPPKGFFRLFPGNKVRLRYGYVIECTGFEKDASGKVTLVRCRHDPETKSGTPGADKVKVKGAIHWLSAQHAFSAKVRLYDRLFRVPNPGAGERDFLDELNPDSVKVIESFLEPSLREARAEERFQFERHGYFVVDLAGADPVDFLQ